MPARYNAVMVKLMSHGVCFLLLLFSLSGCGRRQPVGPESRLKGAVEIGRSVEGRPIECLELGTGPDSTLIIATIHGNENAGTPLVHELADRFRRNPNLLAGRKLLIVPVANPDGYAADKRFNVNGVDLNRNFPASNRQDNDRYGSALSEPESQALKALLDRAKPTRIVSIHQPLVCLDYDGPGEAIARHMGRYCELPVQQIGSRPGSLGSHAGVDLGIPIITMELRRDDEKLPFRDLWRAYGPALAASVVFPEAVPATFFDSQWLVPVVTAGVLIALSVVAQFVRGRRRRGSTLQ
ncbi:MAG: DUF2817 domain-containing protein [Candidatus Sumerlaeaceae bacterium]|nr:DUF2817 domain-containing protein [Candidatus Sumerlaeaceae bacterium]